MVNETYRSYRPKIPNQNFRNFFVNGKQPIFRQNSAEEKVVDSHVQQIVCPCQKKKKKNELLVLTTATFLFLKFKPFF